MRILCASVEVCARRVLLCLPVYVHHVHPLFTPVNSPRIAAIIICHARGCLEKQHGSGPSFPFIWVCVLLFVSCVLIFPLKPMRRHGGKCDGKRCMLGLYKMRVAIWFLSCCPNAIARMRRRSAHVMCGEPTHKMRSAPLMDVILYYNSSIYVCIALLCGACASCNSLLLLLTSLPCLSSLVFTLLYACFILFYLYLQITVVPLFYCELCHFL